MEGRIQIVFNRVTIADTRRAMRVLETSHPPNYYIPPEDVVVAHIEKAPGESMCEWKGRARYVSVVVGEKRADRAGWSYPNPDPAFSPIRDYFAFYAGPMDACYVDGEKVTPQPGGFYGGWITENLQGPFKGAPGTMGW